MGVWPRSLGTASPRETARLARRALEGLLVAGLLLAGAPVTGNAATILLNNGLAPPNPANVIAANYAGSDVAVRNVGCGTTPPDYDDPCASPGAPTSVEVVDPGSSAAVIAYDSSQVLMSGGTMSGLVALDSAAISLTGGSMFSLASRGASSTLMTGGVISFALVAEDTASVEIDGGALATVASADAAQVTLRGGVGAYLGMNILFLQAAGASTIAVHGYDFAVDGQPVPFGDLQAQSGSLTGTLAGGEALDSPFMQGGFDDDGTVYSGTITLVEDRPLPALLPQSQLLLLAGLIALGGGLLSRGAPCTT